MSLSIDSFERMFSEPWLALSRRVTVGTLERKLRQFEAQTRFEAESERMLYVAASAPPYHTSGYTARTHEVIRALEAAGGCVYALTRPGYPNDRPDRLLNAAADETQVDEVRYLHVAAPANNRPVLLYALQAATAVARRAEQHRVSVIHAASNHVNALPALLAARQMGLPFQYEMRGLWELTRISRAPEFEQRQGFKQGLQLEGLVARHADKLFVISEQLGAFARTRWGIPKEKIFLLPNCVDPEKFIPADPQFVEANTIGYAGSLMHYEGLDTLIDAVALLVRQGHPVKVEIVGEGEARAVLEAQVARLGLNSVIHFLGRVSPETAREKIHRYSLICIPRKSLKVCEIVPPIKLVEALAAGKPVVVPDLPVFRDEMGNGGGGWFFKAGDPTDLARVLEEVLADHDTLRATSARAREYATTHRCWRDFVGNALPSTKGRENK